jgi:signal peptidase
VASALVALVLAALVALPLGAVALSYRTYVVLTGSMAPAMPVGTLLVVEPVAAARVAVGDVVTFPHPDRPSETVTHRVVRVDDGPLGRFLQTKGDANPVPDAWRVPASGEVWRVALVVPHLGRLYQAAADPSARLGLLVLPSLFLGGLTLMNLWRGERRAPAPA